MITTASNSHSYRITVASYLHNSLPGQPCSAHLHHSHGAKPVIGSRGCIQDQPEFGMHLFEHILAKLTVDLEQGRLRIMNIKLVTVDPGHRK